MEQVELHEDIREVGQQALQCCQALKAYNYIWWSLEHWKIVHSSAAFLLNSDVLHLLPQSLVVCLCNVKDCFPWRCQTENIRQVERNACPRMQFIAKYYPRIQHRGLSSMLVTTDWTFYSYLTLKRQIVNALKNRFDGLPIHCWIYYISYHHSMTME